MSGYIGTQPVPQATQTRDTFTATAGQTSFATSGYTPGFLDVFLNGVHLVNGTDYTATNGSDVVLTSGATAGDNLEVVAYTTFQTGDFVPTSGGTFAGAVAISAGGLTIDNSAATVLTVDRASSDGTIIDLQKDGSTVGSIGTYANEYYHGSAVGGDTFLRHGYSSIVPATSSGTNRDAAILLGSSLSRFKDLYLSGGVYLGGTGSANLLDDYEEGTFTPVILGYSGTTYTTQEGKYTKIGNLVIAEININVSSIGTFVSNSRIEGWPFAASAATNQNSGQVRLGLATATTVNANSNSLFLGFYLNTSTAFLYSQTGSTYNGNVWQSGVLAATAIYRTNS